MPETDSHHERPSALGHIRVVEMGAIPAAYAGRLLGDLGADVIKVEPPHGDPSRDLPPFAGGIEDKERSLTFIHANTNKRGMVLDPAVASDQSTLSKLLISADLLLESTPFGYLPSCGFTDERLAAINPGLVVVSLTAFGRTGPHRDYKGSDAIANAAGGFLYGQGDDTRGPCTAPSHLAYQIAACVAATLGIAALRHRRRTGVAQHVDVSMQEALTFTNSSSVARYGMEHRLQKRPGGKSYGGAITNIYRCGDGKYVHFTANPPHMWRELTKNWMPHTALAEVEWEDMAYRDARSEEATAIVADFLAQFTAQEFVAEAQKRHLSAAPLNTVGEFVECDQLRAREWLQEIEHPVIGRYRAPGFPMRLSGTPMRVHRPAPLLGQHQQELLADLDRVESVPAAWTGTLGSETVPMLDGLRVADLTQQFAGPLGTAILGYYGMEVVKVESNTVLGRGRSGATHADMNRAKVGCTLNLRDAKGKELFRDLVRQSNVVVENFSVGVMDRLELNYEALSKIKPGLIQVSMPGWGCEGPLRSWVAWGWQLLAYTGLMRLWGYPESPMQSRCKIAWPDRVGAITMALGVVAAIEYQERTGEGQFIEAAMLEAQGAMMGPAIMDYTVNGHDWDALGYNEVLGTPYAPYGCYPCRGDDDWIIVACESDEEWQGLVQLVGKDSWAADARFTTKAARQTHRDELDRLMAGWAKTQTARQAFRRLQAVGVAAGIPVSGEDLYYDLHLRARGHIIELDEPPWGLGVHHGLPGIPSRSPASAAQPAPWIGADNAYVFGEILGLSAETIKELEESGAIK